MPKPWEKYPAATEGKSTKPWERYQAPESTEAPKEIPTSPLASAAYGAAQGATFGFGDELMGAAKSLPDFASKLGSANPFAGTLDKYRELRDKERQNFSQAQKDNPKTYMGGMMAGSLAGSALPGIGIGAGASLGTQIGKAALQGGLTGLGESDAELENPEALAVDAAKGATIAGATQGALGGIAAGASGLKDFLKGFAERRAIKAAIGPNTAGMRDLAGVSMRGGDPTRAKEAIQKAGRNILDEGILTPFAKTENLGPSLKEAASKYGSQIGEVGEAVDKALPNAVDPKIIAQQLAEYAESIPQTLGGKKLQDRVLAEAANFEAMPSLGFGEAQGLKNQFKYKPMDQDALINNQDVSNKIRQILSKNMEGAAEQVSKTGTDEAKDLLTKYMNAKGKYATFKKASDAVGNEQTKDLARRLASPSDYAMGATGITAGALTGNPALAVAGALAGAANKFARERGSSTAALLADSIAKKMEASPQLVKEFGQALAAAAERGPAALTATHHVLMKDPKYRAQFEGESE